MTLLSADRNDFVTMVTQYWLANKGRGLMLSPRETEVVLGWRQTGASASLICQTLKQAVGDFQARNPAKQIPSIEYFVPIVDEAIRSWRHRMVGHNHAGQ